MNLKKESSNPNTYLILDSSNTEIGTITFTIKNNILYLDFLTIFDKGKHYGYFIIDYLLSHYNNFISLTGESTKSARGFWLKCTKKYNGSISKQHKLSNCVFTFMIPRKE